MKVCETCGFHNEVGLTLCKKCGRELSTLAANDLPDELSDGLFSIRGEVPKEEGSHFFGEESLRWTKPKPESDLSEEMISEERPEMPEPGAEYSCPSCWHTPLAALPDPEHPCPNCGYQGVAPPPKSQPNPRHTVVLQDLDLTQADPEFRLVNERKQQDLRFVGESVILRRDNLDPENRSISSRGHARISRVNGQWFLEDESSNQATFIQVKGRIPLQPGDQLILGNKIFRFETE